MLSLRSPLVFVVLLLAVAALPRRAVAGTYDWDGGLSQGSSADANWTTSANWTGASAPPQYNPNNDTDVVFLGTAGRTTSNDNYMLGTNGASGAELRTLTFAAGSTAYTLTGSPYYIGTGGIVQNSTGAQTITAAVDVGATETWTLAAGSGALTLAGGLNVVSGGAFTVNTSGINFSGSTGVVIGGYNPYTGSTSAASALTLTNGATFAPPSVQINYGTFTQDSGTLNTGAVTMGVMGNATYHLSGTGHVTATSLTVGSQTGTNTFQQDAGTVNLGSGLLTVGNSGNGTYTLTSGSVTAGGIALGIVGPGTFNQNGGTVTLSGALTLGSGSHAGSTSTYNLAAGQLMAGSISLGGTSPGVFTQTGGSATVSGTLTVGGEAAGTYSLSGAGSSLTVANVIVGAEVSGSALTVSSGSLNVTAGGSLRVGGSAQYGAGTGTFAQNGGTVAVAGNGALLLGGAQATGTYSLNAGTLTVGSVAPYTGNGPGNSTSTFNFNGGTLQFSASTTSAMTGLTHAYVQAGGAKIDSIGNTVLISQALVHDPALATGVADGGLTKLGSGTLTLSGANTYNGGTLISAGAVEVAGNGAFGTGNVVLGPGGSLLTLDANVTNAIADTAALSLDSTVGGKLSLLGAAGSVQETVATLDFNGVAQAPGTYGASGSGAQFIDNAHFEGTGILLVAVPEPGSAVLAVAGILALVVAARRRRRA